MTKKEILFRNIFRNILWTILFCTFFVSSTSVFPQMIDRSATRVQTTLHTGWKQLGTITPKNVSEVDSSPWALGCETLCRDYIDYNLYKEYIVPLGIKKIRLQGGWAKTEQEKGVYNFQWLDDIINDALGRGLEIWLETDYGNSIYEGGGSRDLGAGFPVSETALAAWDQWVEAMATRYKNKVRDWAMWNEPDRHGGVAIADFNIRTAEIIKRIIPDARIAALSLAGNNPKLVETCLNRFAEKGKLDLFHWVVYHGYSKNPDSSYKNVEATKEIVAKIAPHLKLWQGENGCPSEMAHRFAMSGHPWSELTQCKWNARRMLGDLGHDVVSSVFTICDFDHTGREINRKGLLKINNKTSLAKVKMAYYTVQNIVSVFDGTLERQKEYSCTITSDKTITWFAYRNPSGKDILVFWDGNNIPKDENTTFPVSITVENGGFKDPVWCDVVTGRIHEIPDDLKNISEGKMILSKIPVYDAPVFITDREVILKPVSPTK
ncbi:MAG: hypothetical protein LBP87_14320 [Planctomycetaceae bacterium]|jgi:hypothetical protein|nr:hypothetical protein [Planctomycetaceae bacterium]